MNQIFKKSWDRNRYLIVSSLVLIFIFLLTVVYKSDEQIVLTLKHDGKFESGIASSKFTIVDSSHECSLIGKSGTFRSIEGGKAIYQIS